MSDKEKLIELLQSFGFKEATEGSYRNLLGQEYLLSEANNSVAIGSSPSGCSGFFCAFAFNKIDGSYKDHYIVND